MVGVLQGPRPPCSAGVVRLGEIPRCGVPDPFFHQTPVADEKVGFQSLMRPPVSMKSG